MNFTLPVRGTYKLDSFPFSSYKMADSGEIKISDDVIKLRIGPHHHTVRAIVALRLVRPHALFIEQWVEVVYLHNGMNQSVYLNDHKYFGFLSLFKDRNAMLLSKL